MFVLIGLALLVYVIAENVSIDAGAVAFLIILGLLLVLMIYAGRQNNRAYWNFVDYWANKRYKD